MPAMGGEMTVIEIPAAPTGVAERAEWAKRHTLTRYVPHRVEREDRAGMITLVRTHCVQKRLLQPYDRKGAFRMADGVWQIDGVHSDDGSLITFYVVP